MDSTNWDKLKGMYKSAEDFLADMPIGKAIANVINNPTPQEIGAQVANLGSDISKALSKTTENPTEAALNYSPVGGGVHIIKRLVPTERMIAAFKEGKELSKLYGGKDSYWYKVLTGEAPTPKSYNYEAQPGILSDFFEAGIIGEDLPKPVIGWRYGDIPPTGKSYNYRDQYTEYGVSLMQVEGEPIGKNAFALFGGSNRNKRYVKGYLIERRGSEGEPLIIGAENFDDAKISDKFLEGD